MKQSELQEILKEHEKWLSNDGGKKANLSDADLRGADLRGANLRYTNLRYTNLRGANLRGANLSFADLSFANLSDADLRGADLRGANLRYTNLSDADFRLSIGDGRRLHTIQTEVYHVVLSKSAMAIGCQQHTLEEWWGFTDGEIFTMDCDEALVFWCKWKPLLKEIIEA